MEAFLYTWFIMSGLAIWSYLTISLLAGRPPVAFMVGAFVVLALGGPLSIAGVYYAIQLMRGRAKDAGALLSKGLRTSDKSSPPPSAEPEGTVPELPQAATDFLTRLQELLQKRVDILKDSRRKVPYGQVVWCPILLQDESLIYFRCTPGYQEPVVSHTVHAKGGTHKVFRQGLPLAVAQIRDVCIFEAPTFEEALAWADADVTWETALTEGDVEKRLALWKEEGPKKEA